MIQPFLIGVTMLVSLLGFFRNVEPLVWDEIPLSFGSTNFPTSLDSLTNPSGTDSVATVSHSGQHANANDAIEALEAKLGIGASTPVVNTIFVGTGTGTSGYSTSATSSNFLVSANLTSASSTLWNYSGINGTTTNATSTNFYVSSLASTTQIRANTGTIGALTVTSCTGCAIGIAGIEKASSTNPFATIATTTPLTIGKKVLIFGHCGITISNETKQVAIYVKPASSATSTALALGLAGDTSTGDDTYHISLTGLYNVAATENHEIYLGSPADSKRATVCATGDNRGITYLVFD